MKKQISAILALLLLTSCSSGGASDDTTTASGDVTTTSAEETRLDSLDKSLNYGGEKVVLYVDKMCSLPEFNGEQTGDIVDDAVYARNIAVEERLGVDLEFVEAESSWDDNLESFCNPLRNSILAADSVYDIVAGYGVSVGNLASGLIFTDLSATEHLDFTQPWWSDSLLNDLAVDGKLFFASGDIS